MDKFLHFKSSDFAQETSFIHWVNASNASDINQWNKWIADHPEKRQVIEQAKSIVNTIHFKDDSIAPDLEDKIWKNISASTSTKGNASNSTDVSPNGMVRVLKKWAPLAAAAIIALLVYVNIPTGINYDTNVQTSFAENSQELLPDGSIIDINAESAVAYSSQQWETDRKIKLEGEAFFSVKKGSKFTVVTDNGNVEVLGTSFNVFSRDNVFSVECETGKVSVTAEGKEIILLPNQGVRIDIKENEVIRTEVSNKRSTWRRGTFDYKDVVLREVFDDVERHFNTKITGVDESISNLYTGKFKSSNIDSVLHQICWPLDLEVSKTAQGYQVKSIKK